MASIPFSYIPDSRSEIVTTSPGKIPDAIGWSKEYRTGASALSRKYTVVLPLSGSTIQYSLTPVHTAAGRRYDLCNQIRSSAASPVRQLRRITDHGNIRLYPVTVFPVQVDRERGRIYFAVSSLFPDILPDRRGKFQYKFLMDPFGRRHIIEFPIDQFRTTAIRKVPVIL